MNDDDLMSSYFADTQEWKESWKREKTTDRYRLLHTQFLRIQFLR